LYMSFDGGCRESRILFMMTNNDGDII